MFNAFMQVEEKDGLVKLTDSKGNSRNFFIDSSDTLVIRHSDRHLWTLFSKAVLEGTRIGKELYNGMVVLGPEGVGKVCSFYMAF